VSNITVVIIIIIIIKQIQELNIFLWIYTYISMRN
jgi:hypothetical protein